MSALIFACQVLLALSGLTTTIAAQGVPRLEEWACFTQPSYCASSSVDAILDVLNPVTCTEILGVAVPTCTTYVTTGIIVTTTLPRTESTTTSTTAITTVSTTLTTGIYNYNHLYFNHNRCHIADNHDHIDCNDYIHHYPYNRGSNAALDDHDRRVDHPDPNLLQHNHNHNNHRLNNVNFPNPSLWHMLIAEQSSQRNSNIGTFPCSL
jgi:hypothetical protein